MQFRPVPASVFARRLACVGLFISISATAQESLETLLHQTQILQQEIHQLKSHYEAQVSALERRVMELERSARSPRHPSQSRTLTAEDEVTAKEGGQHQSDASLKWAFAGLSAVGGSTASAKELELLQGGSHDPRKNGFTVQAVALAAKADFGENMSAVATIVSHIEPNGESVVELGPAYFQATALPLDLSLKVGQFFQGFGEENRRHAADWDFVDVPFLITRLFGSDKLRTQGIEIAWDVPLPWASTLYGGAFNPKGETAASFLYEEGESVGGHIMLDRSVEGVSDLLYMLNWSHDFQAGTRERMGLGTSVLFGPNASGYTTNTQIYGLHLDWAHYLSSQSQQRLFDWRAEAMYRRYEAGDKSQPNNEKLTDYGVFTQFLWHIRDDWTVGLRAEFANGNQHSSDDPFRGDRNRFAINLTHRVTPSLWWRLQYNRDHAEFLSDTSADSIWLQLGYKVGEHDEH